jgi:hypothetical protein
MEQQQKQKQKKQKLKHPDQFNEDDDELFSALSSREKDVPLKDIKKAVMKAIEVLLSKVDVDDDT